MDNRLAVEAERPQGRDSETREWLAQLHSHGRVREQALQRLHELMLKAAYAQLWTRPERLPPDVVDELALEAADDAVVRLVTHLDDFRGASRFTTWAFRFAITEVSVALRHYRRQRREVPLEPDAIVLLVGSRSSVERQLETSELLRVLGVAVSEALTARQREALLGMAVDGESPQAIAAALQTNPGALYKAVHDARRKLRASLAERGLSPTGEVDEDVQTSPGKNPRGTDSNLAEAMELVT